MIGPKMRFIMMLNVCWFYCRGVLAATESWSDWLRWPVAILAAIVGCVLIGSTYKDAEQCRRPHVRRRGRDG